MSVRLAILGGFQITCDGRPAPLPTSEQRLVAFLAVHARPMRRSHVSECLWIESSQLRSHANLRSALWRIKQCGVELLAIAGDSVTLHPDVRVDLHEAMALAQKVLAGDVPRGLQWSDLLKDLLPDSDDEWVVLEREYFRQLRLHALERLCEAFVEQQLLAEAVAAGISAVNGEPLRESAQRALVRAYLAEGNASEAIRQYWAYRTLLMRELRLAPSPDLEELMAPLAPSVSPAGLAAVASS